MNEYYWNDMPSNMERKTIGKCGKVCFDKKSAQTKKNWLEEKGKEKHLRIYACDQCDGFWHLTKKP